MSGNAKQRRKRNREPSIWGKGAYCGICGDTLTDDPTESHGEISYINGEVLATCRSKQTPLAARPAAQTTLRIVAIDDAAKTVTFA